MIKKNILSKQSSYQAIEKTTLMTHVIAGYPNFDISYQLIRTMVDTGVSYIEIQFPFSDPLGDGSTIMQANQKVLEQGISTQQCFDFIAQIRDEIPIPLLIMTYANVPYRFGIKKFLQYSKKLNIAGFIIPDLPFDEEEFNVFIINNNIPMVPVISANIDSTRLQTIADFTTYLLYCTLRIGITGAKKHFDSSIFQFLQHIRTCFSVPIIGGFGISSINHITALKSYVDILVVGSHIINILNREGIRGVNSFLHQAIHSISN